MPGEKGREQSNFLCLDFLLVVRHFYLDYHRYYPFTGDKKKKNHHDYYFEAYITASNLP